MQETEETTKPLDRWADPISRAHSHSSNVITELLDVRPEHGLSTSEVELRLERDGRNSVETAAGYSWWHILIAQFSSIVIWMLIAAAVVAWFTRNELEAAAILAVLVINATIGFLIEWQAGRALDALRRESVISARVRRNGIDQEIDTRELVVGDILVLSAGERVPADARLLESNGLRTDESTLTGESEPVEKSADSVGAAALLAERTSMVYMATMIVAGKATAVVTATGARTELGRIGQLMAKSSEEKTPLERRLAELGKRLVYVVLGIAALVLIAGLLRGDNIWLMLEVAISLAVAAVPEGLPAVTTLILAIGVLKMARRNSIVRRLAAVEALGSTTVICTDKTGTLTENRMTVRKIVLADGRTVISATETGDDQILDRLLLVAVLCNDASLAEEKEIGDPTETALLAAASRHGMNIPELRSRYSKLKEYPFDAGSKRMITAARCADGEAISMMKGAPSVILKASGSIMTKGGVEPLDEVTMERLRAENEEMASSGLRVLGFAQRPLSVHEADRLTCGQDVDLTSGYTFLGFVAMSDPPRTGAAEAIRSAREAGIRVVMLTGDQLSTAKAIARELNINGGDSVTAFNGSDIIGASREELATITKSADVFSRVSPEDKLQIVDSYREFGEIVAVTGDGINDAPALRAADIGIAMGLRGTEVAKEAADVVLTDDNFLTIVKAIEGGRTIYANIIKFVNLLFSTNLAEVIVIFTAIVVGLPLPLLPLQILWVNLVTDIFPAFALAVEPPTRDVLIRKPRPPDESLLSRQFFMLIAGQGMLLAIVTMGAYLWALSEYGEGAHARTVALFSLIGAEVAHVFNCRSRTRSALEAFWANPFIFASIALMLVLQVAAYTITPLTRALDLVVPNGADWIVIGLSITTPLVVVEIVKSFVRSRPALAGGRAVGSV